MSLILPDGGVICSNLGCDALSHSANSNAAGMFGNGFIQLGQIIDVWPIDSDRNRSKKFTEYDVLVSDRGITVTRFHNCRALDGFGAGNNFSETIFTPTTEGRRGKKSDSEAFAYKNGSMVLIACLGGKKETGIIVGAVQHPIVHQEAAVAPQVASKSASVDARLKELPQALPGIKSSGDNEGQRILGEFQGLRWNINKYGELTIIYQGPKDANGQFTAATTQPTIFKINKDGEIIFLDNLDQEIKISRKDQKIVITSGNTEPDFIEVDRATKTITVQSGADQIHNVGKDEIHNISGNLKETVAGREDIFVTGDALVKIDGQLNEKVGGNIYSQIGGQSRTVTGGKWKVRAGGAVTLQSPSSIRLIAPSISLLNSDETFMGSDNIIIGGQSASEPLVLGNAMALLFNLLVSYINGHTHPGGVPQPATPFASTMGANELSTIAKTEKTFSGIPAGAKDDD